MGSRFNWLRTKREAIDEVVRRAKSKWGITLKKKDLQPLSSYLIKYKLWGCIEGNWEDQFIQHLKDHRIPYEFQETKPPQEPLLPPREEQPHTKPRTHCPACRNKLPKPEPGEEAVCWCQK